MEEAHRRSFKNRDEVEKSSLCGCFYCEKSFSSEEIDEWVDDGETALCPFCGIDSVIGSAAGFKLDRLFLHSMNERWFS
ncbi:MAG TPA: cytoplasmic protein [Candidatus Angelobacter sp.]|nr:cytoplasmic protein [Candidatus Angelobacter sp.]